MKAHRLVAVLASATALLFAAPLLATAAPASGAVARPVTWRPAIEVPGLATLNTGGYANIWSVSCASTGNCTAGGAYSVAGRPGYVRAYVVSERNGSWHKAIEVPGSGVLGAGGGAFVTSVSCASAGNCAAGGDYTDGSRRDQAFVVSERNGSWGKAIEVPGLGALNAGGGAEVNSVSCASPGDCVAGGSYAYKVVHYQAFVVTERNGTWGKARQVPGSAALNKDGNAQVNSVSCASAGNCAAGGHYTDGAGHWQAFVVSERKGSWGKAIDVPGLGVLNKDANAQVSSVSCGSAGNCAAGGYYLDHLNPVGDSSGEQAFVVTERNGSWGKAIEVPGSGTLNVDNAAVASVSCASAGNCAAGGFYTYGMYGGMDLTQAFVVSERNGSWGKAIEVPGSGTLNSAGSAAVNSVSCASAGNCVAGGSYRDTRPTANQAFVVTERNGTWRKAIEVPGSGTLNVGGNAGVSSVSCAPAGTCSAVGFYSLFAAAPQVPFVASQA